VQVRVNDRLVKGQARIGAIALGITFLMLLAGMFLSWQIEPWAATLAEEGRGWVPIAITYAIVIAAMAVYYFGNTRLRRYGPKHRQDGRLFQILKGLDDRHVLYAFPGRNLPDYVLVGPSGVHVLTARPQGGEVTCREDRWSVKGGAGRRLFSALYGNPIGSPSWDTAQGVQKVQAFLSQRLPACTEPPPVDGIVVLTGEAVRLRAERCSFTATTARELRRVITRMKGRLSGPELAQVRVAFESELQA
jgi:hypothetical protein